MKYTATTQADESLPLFADAPSKKNLASEIVNEFDANSSTKVVKTLGLSLFPAVISGGLSGGTSPLSVRKRYGVAAKSLGTFKQVNWQLKKHNNSALRAALIGLHQGGYTFDRYRKKKTPQLEEVFLQNLAKNQKKVLFEAEVTSAAIKLCRDLINTPTEDMGPDQFVKEALREAKGTGLKVKVMSEVDCKKAKMGALIAVGRASHRKPRMLILEWSGGKKTSGKKKSSFLALCGKGVCFDTGGLDIKPAHAMLLMRKDMGGAATVLAAMLVLAKLKSKTNVRAYIPLVENSIGPDAFRPGDVLTAANGTTIEVGHTDAEGRLVLADAISLAEKEGAKGIVTVATLTGAAMVALGRIHIPIMGDGKLVAALSKGAKSSGEKVWRLPMDEEHKNLVRGKMADLTNSDGSGEAGCITAGAFLSHFAGDVPFAHCDISPACWKPAPHALGPAGATGALVTTLVDAFRDFR